MRIKVNILKGICVAILVISFCVGCGSSDTSSTTAEIKEVEATTEDTATAESESAESENGDVENNKKSNISKSGYDIVATLESYAEASSIGFSLTDSQKEFINSHLYLFPADEDDFREMESYIDYDLDYAHMTKNPGKYRGSFAYLDRMEAVQVTETAGQDGEYSNLTRFNLADQDGNAYYIYYIGESVDVVEGDYVRMTAMPIDNASYENLYGDRVLTLVMLASYAENSSSENKLGEFISPNTNPEMYSISDEITYDAQAEADYGDEDFILPYSSSRYYTKEELSSYTKEELRLARNEIYAWHGRLFDSEDLKRYFNSKTWYNGYLTANEFDESVLNDYEKKNLVTIKAVEDSLTSDSGNTPIDIVYGVYEYDNGTDNVMTAEVGFETDSGSDYIRIDALGYGGHYTVNYEGTLYEQINDGSYPSDEEWSGTRIYVTFYEGGMSIYVSNTDYEGYYVLDGYYTLTKALDLRNVG